MSRNTVAMHQNELVEYIHELEGETLRLAATVTAVTETANGWKEYGEAEHTAREKLVDELAARDGVIQIQSETIEALERGHSARNELLEAFRDTETAHREQIREDADTIERLEYDLVMARDDVDGYILAEKTLRSAKELAEQQVKDLSVQVEDMSISNLTPTFWEEKFHQRGRDIEAIIGFCKGVFGHGPNF